MNKRFKDRAGFTLIEMLIVIIILGILAMVIIPQISVSTDDAKVSTLKGNLAGLRSAIEIYYAQHSNKYPGMTDSTNGNTNNDAGVAASSMVLQLEQYTSSSGKVQTTKDGTFKYGPYVKTGLPTNPFNEKKTVVCDATTDIAAAKAPSGGAGWKFHFNTGVLYADDNTLHAGY